MPYLCTQVGTRYGVRVVLRTEPGTVPSHMVLRLAESQSESLSWVEWCECLATTLEAVYGPYMQCTPVSKDE